MNGSTRTAPVRGLRRFGTPPPWARPLRRRLHEPAFWAIQAAVLSITGLHLAVEALDLFADRPVVASGLHHVPVILYLIPIVFAGLRYGFEGAVLTSGWALVLTLPNIFVWHSGSFMWASELLYVSVVVGIGVAVAAPVERERRQRERLVATSRRLALLNDVASALVSSVALERTLPAVLERLRDVLVLEAAGFARWEPAPASDLSFWSSPPERERELRAVLERARPRLAFGAVRDDWWMAAPLGRGPDVVGALLVVPEPDRPLGKGDEELLAAVASQIRVALDNERLHGQEKERLRSYVHEVTRVQEEERKHLARELHDTTAQDLILICRGLDALAEAAAFETSAGGIGELRRRAGETLEAVRRLSRDLRPTVLDDLGLVPALEWLTADLTRRTRMQAAFRITGEARRLAPDVELALFRITQEALRNVERHSGADRADVSVAFGGAGVEIEVADDGVGFVVAAPPEHLARSSRLGLLGIRERTQLVGGAVSIDSEPGRGTRLSVSVSGQRAEPGADSTTRPPERDEGGSQGR